MYLIMSRFVGQRKVEDLPRLRGRAASHRLPHIIEWLVRKPGAFENLPVSRDLFRPAGFAWHTTRCGKACRSERQRDLKILNWQRRLAKFK